MAARAVCFLPVTEERAAAYTVPEGGFPYSAAAGDGGGKTCHPGKGNQIMLYYLIVCRSLTYAQRTAAALERAGITARILRSPKSIAGEGCSHSVKISQRSLPDALRVLRLAYLTPKRIYITAGDGGYQEVEL